MKVWSLSMSKSKYPVYMHFIFFFQELIWLSLKTVSSTIPSTTLLTGSWQTRYREPVRKRATHYCYLLFIIFYLTRIVNKFNASSLVAASVCQGENGHCSSGLEWLETAVDTISLSQTLTRAVHLCSIHRFQSGQHSADLIISLRTKKCMHTWQTQTFTVALAPVYLVQLRMSNYFNLRWLASLLSPSAATGHPAPLLLWTVTHREKAWIIRERKWDFRWR